MSYGIISTVFLMVLLPGIGASGQVTTPDSLSSDSVRLSTTLDNGMRVVIHSLPEGALTRVGVFFAAGGATDPDSLVGLAHFSEHLLTESSLNFPDGELIRQVTLLSTYRNAYTSSAYMQFDTECLPVFLPRVLELEADRFRGVRIDSVSFEREKGIVLEEMAMRKRLSPTQELQESLFRACYPGHPFSREVIGIPATVGRIRREDFQAFQEQYIRPENSALIVKGPVDPDSTLAVIEKYFAFGPEGEAKFPETPPYPAMNSSQVIIDSHDHTGMILGLAFRVPLEDEMDAAFVSVLPTIMEESRLYPYITSVPGEAIIMLVIRGAYNRPSTNPMDHWATIYYEFDPEQQCLRYMGYLWEDIADLMNEVADPDEFENRLARAIENLGDDKGNAGTSSGLGSSLVNGNEYLTTARIRELLGDSGPEEFNRFMGRWISTDQVIVGVSHGKDSERPAAVTMAGSSTAVVAHGAKSHLDQLAQQEIEPILTEYRKSKLINLSRYFLFNGTPVYDLELPGSDQFFISGYRTGEGVKDMRPGKKPGIAQIYNRVVNYDDRQRPDPNNETRPKRLPFEIQFKMDWNNSRLSAKGTGKRAEDIIAALDRRVTSREFNNSRWYSVTQWGEGYLEYIAERKTNVARAWRWEQLLGQEHPSLGQWAPEPDSLRKIKYKDLTKLHHNGFQKTENLSLLVTGGNPDAGIQTLLNQTFGEHDKWRSGKKPDLPEDRLDGIKGKVISDLTRGDVVLDVAFPPVRIKPGAGAVATVLVLEAALDHVLTERLREKEGLTYSAGSRIFPLTGSLLWEITVTCQPGSSPEVFRIVREELGRITETGFTGDEIARARLKLVGQIVRNLCDQESGLRQLRRFLELGDIPLDPLRELSQVKTEGVNDLFLEVNSSEHFVFTATGPLFEEDIDLFAHLIDQTEELLD